MKKLETLLLTAAVGAVPVLAGAWGNDCRAKAPREATVDAAGATTLRVEARGGSLAINGEKGLTEVQARGTACASSEKALGKVKLVADRDGDVVRVIVETPGGWNEGGALDLELKVPAGLALDVQDGGGEVEVDGVASLQLKDGSGEIGITGVEGDVRINDGSGGLEVLDVGGSVTVERDGSGEIVVRGVEGNVVVERDGSGSIRVEDVGGSLTVRKDGSGSVRHSGVQGTVSIPED